MGETIFWLAIWPVFTGVWVGCAVGIVLARRSHKRFMLIIQVDLSSIGWDPYMRLVFPKPHKIRRWKNDGWRAIKQDLSDKAFEEYVSTL